jgi:YrbI family 3-deoxy-D-manno-octulosonate 8-phosphate phosphatase
MIKLVLFDIDGVLTDGKVTIDDTGREYKTLDYRDIDGIFELKRQGVMIGFLTGEATPIANFFRERFAPDFFYLGCKDKLATLAEILHNAELTADEVCYIGDGWRDLPVIESLKYGACPSNALPAVRKAARLHMKSRGGDGCVHELVEWVMIERQKPTNEVSTSET